MDNTIDCRTCRDCTPLLVEQQTIADRLTQMEATISKLVPLIDLANTLLESPTGKLQMALLWGKHGRR